MSDHSLKNKINFRCANCGKTIARNTRGSLTAWLFRTAECRCEFEAAKNLPAPADGKMRPAEPGADVATCGEVIDDRYEVIDLIGTGGMGAVYRVRDRRTNKIFALKMISPKLAEDKVLAKRLQHEGDATKSLTHPNIVAVYDVGSTNGAPYLVMDLVDGISLEHLLQTEPVILPSRALNIFVQIAEALAHAHAKKIVHRDLKPSNILLTSTADLQDIVKLVDFGIAKFVEPDVDRTKLTQPGEVIGTPWYMSPEQCTGGELDGRSDVYSLGCVMYEALTGRVPFTGHNPMAIMLKQISDEPAPLPNNAGISNGLKKVVAKSLQKAPLDRYAAAADLLSDLERVRDGKPIRAVKKRARQRKSLLMPVAIGLCGLFGLATIYSVSVLRSLTAPVAPQTEAVLPPFVPGSWDSLDVRGQQYFNHGEYNRALNDFLSAAKLPDASLDQRIMALHKVALVQHALGQKTEEKQTDDRIRNLERKKPKNGALADMNALEKALALVPEDVQSTKAEQVRSLAEDLLATARQLNNQSEYVKSDALLRATLPKLEKLLGQQSPVILGLHGVKVDALLHEEKSKEALPIAEATVNRLLETSQDTDLELNENLVRLAKLYNSEKQGGQAEAYAQMAMDNLVKVARSDKQEALLLQAHLAYAESLWLRQQFEQASEEFVTCVKMADKQRDAEVLELALSGLDKIYENQNDFERAQQTLLNLLKGSEDKPLLIKAAYMDSLGGLYYRQETRLNLWPKAEPYFRQALSIRQHLQLPHEKDVRESLRTLIGFEAHAKTQGKIRPAAEREALCRQLVAILERFPSTGQERARAYSYLTTLLIEKKDIAGAQRLFQGIIRLARQDETISNAFDEPLYRVARQLPSDEDPLLQVQSIFEARIRAHAARDGDNSVAFAQALDDLGHVLYKKGERQKAREASARAAELVLRHQPESLPSSQSWQAAEILDNHAFILSRTASGDDWRKYNDLADEYRYSRATKDRRGPP